jgi:hypothetical protein
LDEESGDGEAHVATGVMASGAYGHLISSKLCGRIAKSYSAL